VAPVNPVAPAGSPVQAEAGAGTEAPPALSTASHRFKVAFVFLVALSVYGFAHVALSSRYEESDDPRVTVWWYGWLTAASTGLGVVPFLFVREMGPLWLGRCNGTCASPPPPLLSIHPGPLTQYDCSRLVLLLPVVIECGCRDCDRV
jgi:hypothetical protein